MAFSQKVRSAASTLTMNEGAVNAAGNCWAVYDEISACSLGQWSERAPISIFTTART